MLLIIPLLAFAIAAENEDGRNAHNSNDCSGNSDANLAASG
jgi:hypothetical protein